MNRILFTSESVTEGHPDKVCDQISDAVLDEILSQDPDGRVACETTATTGIVNVMGEITTKAVVDVPKIVRKVLTDIGYTKDTWGFDADNCAIVTSLDTQSPDIAMGVNASLEQKDGSGDSEDMNGAGDQGMMFGYACDETEEYMPLSISLAHKLAMRLTQVRKESIIEGIGPDGKTQVTVAYDEDMNPLYVDTVVISVQHLPKKDLGALRDEIIEKVITPIIPSALMRTDTNIYVNPTGRFVVGGPKGDSGLTGRKIIVDTYGGFARHGGGAFSGKDPSKDRSGAYMARYVAKNIVAAGLAKRCEVQIAYAIGVAKPVSLMIDTFGTGKYKDWDIAEAVNAVFDLRPTAIINTLDLKKPIYRKLAAYGHLGRNDLNVKWENTDRINELITHCQLFESEELGNVNRRGSCLV